jgi:hypothetical protein
LLIIKTKEILVKNTIKSFWVIILIVIIGLGFITCSDGGGSRLKGEISIIGHAQVGHVLSVDTSKLENADEISFRWNASVWGHEETTYTVRWGDIGNTITVTVNRGNRRITSAPTAVVVGLDVPTLGLRYSLINNGTAYSVSRGESTATTVVIPAVYEGLPVVEIADSGFSSHTEMTSIIIPYGVTRIGNYAFFQCSNLESIVIPVSITNIGNFAFSGCTSLSNIFYGGANNSQWSAISIGTNNTPIVNADLYYYSETDSGLETDFWYFSDGFPRTWRSLYFWLIDDGTAYSVSGGNTSGNLFIPATYKGLPVVRIGVGGFRGFTNLTSITIPDSVTSIGESAFYGCTGLTSITIPNSVTSIGESAFYGCTGLTSITIPNSVTSIGNDAFRNCTGLTSVTLPNNPNFTTIGAGAFSGCIGLTSIVIPNSVTSIGGSAFNGCTGLSITWHYNPALTARNFSEYLTTVIIPDSVTSIGDWAFNDCTGLTSIVIPNSVTEIGNWAFQGCTGLTSITIPNSVTEIGDYVFNSCTNLTLVTILNPTPPNVNVQNRGWWAFLHTHPNLRIEVPVGSVDAYKAAYGWREYADRIFAIGS